MLNLFHRIDNNIPLTIPTSGPTISNVVVCTQDKYDEIKSNCSNNDIIFVTDTPYIDNDRKIFKRKATHCSSCGGVLPKFDDIHTEVECPYCGTVNEIVEVNYL